MLPLIFPSSHCLFTQQTPQPQGLKYVWEGAGGEQDRGNAEGRCPTSSKSQAENEHQAWGKDGGLVSAGAWGVLLETGNQRRWQDQINSIKGAVPRQVHYSKYLSPLPPVKARGGRSALWTPDSLSSQAYQESLSPLIALSLTPLGFPNTFTSKCPTAPAQCREHSLCAFRGAV